MQTGFRVRAYPTRFQEQTLLRWIGCQRAIYNAKVAEDRYFRTFARKALGVPAPAPKVDQAYSHFITADSAWFRDVPSQVLRNGAVRFKDAYQRFFSRLGGRPTIKKKIGRQSVWITSELFTWDVRRQSDEIYAHTLVIGTRKCPVGMIVLEDHRLRRASTAPKSIHVSVEAGRWSVSFNLEDDTVLPTAQETADELALWSEQDLLAASTGVDRGVVIPVATSRGQAFDFSDVQKARMEKKARGARRQQRRLARQVRGSKNRAKTKLRLARKHEYARCVRADFAHKTSHALVEAPGRLIVFEDLGVQRMTRAPRARKSAAGRFEPNGAAAKTGLNAAILRSAWGLVQTYTQYKALRRAKLAIAVPAHHTSQECARCGHTSPENRRKQAAFICQACGHEDNADHNAARVIARRGVLHILSGGYREREPVRAALRRDNALRRESSDVKPVEPEIRREPRKRSAQRASKQETPTTTERAV